MFGAAAKERVEKKRRRYKAKGLKQPSQAADIDRLVDQDKPRESTLESNILKITKKLVLEDWSK